ASMLPFDTPAQTAKRFRIGVVNTALAPNAPMVEGLRAGLTQLGMQEGRDVSFDIRFTRGDLRAVSTAAEELAKARVDLIFANGTVAARAAKAATLTIPIVFTVVPDPVASGLVNDLANPGRMLELSRAQKVPAVFPTTLWIEQGALASYGSDPYEEGVQAAALVAKILKGAKPPEVPIEGARKLVFAINKETAGAMGITVPPELLKRADRVVE